MIKKIIFEPLLHFLILGGIIYTYFNLTTTGELTEKKKITISPHELNIIKTNFRNKYGYDANEEQLKSLTLQKSYEKMLLNEAYSLGLHTQDKEISEKLLKQIHFIMANQQQNKEPTEEELLEYYKNNISDYSIVNNLSFSHIYFPTKQTKLVDDTLTLLQIANVSPQKALYYGEKFKESNTIENINLVALEELFGKYFSSKVIDFKIGMWHKPLHSKHGTHIVYVTEKNTSTHYSFDEHQERIYLDYLQEKKDKQVAKAYKEFKSQYIFEEK